MEYTNHFIPKLAAKCRIKNSYSRFLNEISKDLALDQLDYELTLLKNQSIYDNPDFCMHIKKCDIKNLSDQSASTLYTLLSELLAVYDLPENYNFALFFENNESNEDELILQKDLSKSGRRLAHIYKLIKEFP